MSLFSYSPTVPEDKVHAVRELVARTAHDRDFYVLLLGATVLAIGAIFSDNMTLLIASMLVAPLAYPILGLGLGLATGRITLLVRSLILLIAACAVVLAIAAGATLLFGGERVQDKYVSFTGDRTTASIVAVASGAIAAYGLIRPKVATAITGVAIAVSLLPPLTAAGIGFAAGDLALGSDGLILFLLNVTSILIASSVVFLLFNMRQVREI